MQDPCPHSLNALYNIVTCRVVQVTEWRVLVRMIGFLSALWLQPLLNTLPFSAIAIPHTLQSLFTLVHIVYFQQSSLQHFHLQLLTPWTLNCTDGTHCLHYVPLHLKSSHHEFYLRLLISLHWLWLLQPTTDFELSQALADFTNPWRISFYRLSWERIENTSPDVLLEGMFIAQLPSNKL
jgi:hypothetical protein